MTGNIIIRIGRFVCKDRMTLKLFCLTKPEIHSMIELRNRKGDDLMAQTINANNISAYLNKVVKIADLSSIYDLWMILIRPRNSGLSEDEGILSFVGKEPNEESYLLYNKENAIIPVYNDSMELESDLYYEE